MNILILGGTGEARDLATRLVALSHRVTTSLAGRTREPILPAGELRVGKFGGVPGLVGYLRAMRFDRLVDATHPYAGLISINAVAAAQQTGIPLVRYMRPEWAEPEGAAWTHVRTLDDAAEALPPSFPPFFAASCVSGWPRPEPDLLPPPDSLFTVAQARRSASLWLTPRSS